MVRRQPKSTKKSSKVLKKKTSSLHPPKNKIKINSQLINFLKIVGWYGFLLLDFYHQLKKFDFFSLNINLDAVKKLPAYFSQLKSLTREKFSLIPRIKLPKFTSKFSKFKKVKTKKRTKSKKVTIYSSRYRKFQQILEVLKNFPWSTVLSLTISIIILVSAYQGYVYIFKDLPSAADLTKRQQIVSTKIYDRYGRLLYRVYKDENRTVVPLSQIPQNLINATIAIEDKEYYDHHGFSIRGIIRAVIANIQGKSIQGGSTITQQLIKNTLLTPEKTLKRKIREVLLSIIVDAAYTKDEILEMYFNEIPYGGSTYGAEEAAQRYFGKSARDLSLAESAMLAGLPAAPTIYSPFGTNPEMAYERQAEVLRRMVEDKYITPEQASEAKKEVLHFASDTDDIRAPHFVMYIKNLLAQRYGEDVLETQGLEVRTTLDLDVQNIAQEEVAKEVDKLKPLRVSNGAALVTNPQTGEVLAMVGSRNYFDFGHDGQVNVTIRPRQPGSSIKPLTYATAMEQGKLTPSSTIQDAPITYQIAGSPPYSPKNYDGRYHGNVTVRESLGSSYNIPAVKTLASVGLNSVIDKGQQMGITTWNDRSRFGLSLTLGGGEVLMTDMATLYGAFANYGYRVDLNPILEVKNYQGETLYHNSCALDNLGCPRVRVIDPRVAYQITNILMDNKARTPAFGPRSVLYIPDQQVAVKTGTTNNLRDNWTFGYTTDRLVATWVGNNNNQPMSYVASGITGASPIWNNITRRLLSTDKPNVFPEPAGLVKVNICRTSGTLPCKGCPNVGDEYFMEGTQPTTACNPTMFQPKAGASPDPNREQQQGQIL
jgi:1A family penicillin-binding protein